MRTYVFNNNCYGSKNRICTAVSVHDGDNLTKQEFITKIPEINAKYTRRFERLYNLLNSDTDVIIVRLIKPKDQGAIENSPETASNLEMLHKLLMYKFQARITFCIVDKDNTINLDNDSNIIKFNSFDELKSYIIKQSK